MRKSQPFMRQVNNVELPQLEREHQVLKQRVAELERRAHLTPSEQMEATELKKKKLVVKDTIAEIRRTIPPS